MCVCVPMNVRCIFIRRRPDHHLGAETVVGGWWWAERYREGIFIHVLGCYVGPWYVIYAITFL